MKKIEIRAMIVRELLAQNAPLRVIKDSWLNVLELTEAVYRGKFPKAATQEEIDDAQLGHRHV